MPYFPHFRTCIFYDIASVNDPLDCNCSGFTATDAERGDAAFEVLCLQRMQQRHDQAGTGGADGMAERAGAAVDVQLVARNSEILLRCHRHHREGLVDLEQVDVADAPADLVQELA